LREQYAREIAKSEVMTSDIKQGEDRKRSSKKSEDKSEIGE